MTMILKQGKFYINNVEIPVEFGNADQIRLHKLEQQKIDQLAEGIKLDFDVETWYTYSAQIKCTCGKNVTFEKEDQEYEYKQECLADKKKECWNCKKEYKTYMENGQLMIKSNQKL